MVDFGRKSRRIGEEPGREPSRISLTSPAGSTPSGRMGTGPARSGGGNGSGGPTSQISSAASVAGGPRQRRQEPAVGAPAHPGAAEDHDPPRPLAEGGDGAAGSPTVEKTGRTAISRSRRPGAEQAG